jgi:4-oxalocrotonate tautomerase
VEGCSSVRSRHLPTHPRKSARRCSNHPIAGTWRRVSAFSSLVILDIGDMAQSCGLGTDVEEAMPEVVVYALEGRSVDQKRGLVKDITSALVKNYGVPADAVVVTVVETAKHDKAKGGVLFSEMSVPPQAKAS